MNEFLTIRNWCEEDRPREKLIKGGRNALSNVELLAILIATGTNKKTALDLAREVLNKANHDLNQLAKWTVKDYCKIEGIGPAKAVTLISAIELTVRKQKSEYKEKSVIQTSKDAYQVMRHHLEDLNHEEFWVLTLNRRNSVISKHQISIGGITSTIVDQRKIFKIALDDISTGIVLFHNHPSGNHLPSESDNQLTKKLKAAGNLLDINVLDHLIITQDNYYSYVDEGKM